MSKKPSTGEANGGIRGQEEEVAGATASTCLILSRHIIPVLSGGGRCEDLMSLAEACPELLASACARGVSGATNGRGSLLTSAAAAGRDSLVKSELSRLGTEVGRRVASRDGWKAFRGACVAGHTGCARLLADSLSMTRAQAMSREGFAFWLAARNGHTEVVRFIADRFCLSRTDAVSDGCRAFREACGSGRLETAKFLASRFCITKSDARGGQSSPLLAACAGGHADVVSWLCDALSLGANDARADGNFALASALSSGNAEISALLVSRFGLTRGDVLANSTCALAAQHALRAGRPAVVSVLVDQLCIHESDFARPPAPAVPVPPSAFRGSSANRDCCHPKAFRDPTKVGRFLRV